MNKERLVELGATEELAGKIFAELDGNYIPKSRFNEVNTELKQVKDQLKERDEQLEGLKKTTGNTEELQKQIETLQKENKEKDDAHAAEIYGLKVDTAVENALKDAGCINNTAARALLNLKDAKLGDDGKVVGLSEQIKTLTETENSKVLFKEQKGQAGAKGFVPGQGKDGHPDGAPDLSKMSYEQLATYLSEHPDTKLE